MGSDSLSNAPALVTGNNVQVSFATNNDGETDRILNGLANGRKVIMPLMTIF